MMANIYNYNIINVTIKLCNKHIQSYIIILIIATILSTGQALGDKPLVMPQRVSLDLRN